jgi:hypothetical protein
MRIPHDTVGELGSMDKAVLMDASTKAPKAATFVKMPSMLDSV